MFLRSRRGRAAIAVGGAIVIGLFAWALDAPTPVIEVPFILASVAVGVPLALDVARGILHRTIGADVLALLTITTAGIIGEWLVAAVIALMVTTGAALEDAASRRASQVLRALAQRSPRIAHLRREGETARDVDVDAVAVGDTLVVLPHEITPVDGIVVEGSGSMDEAYLTGEPYQVPKTIGSPVLSGAINGPRPLVITATQVARESRYAQIADVLRVAESQRPPMRRLADRLGLLYTVIALALASVGWWIGGDVERFLAVLVIATPCPLLIGIPVAILGAISRAAHMGIIVKDPAVLERIDSVQTMIFDKTGTLTYGRPRLTRVQVAPGFDESHVLSWLASIEEYSRHPLASAIREATEGVALATVDEVAEVPGHGLHGRVDGHTIVVTGRVAAVREHPEWADILPAEEVGLECVVIIDDCFAALVQFRDQPRPLARPFVHHLGSRHAIPTTMLISGDRASEVEYLADSLGIEHRRSSVSPERKLELVREQTARGPTLFLGDGINDAPAMTAATVGVAFGQGNQITAEAAGAVVLDSSFDKLDELLHLSHRMRRIALQTAVGGITASAIGMVLAIVGLLPPLAGAIAQEVIDVLAIVNSMRVAIGSRPLADLDRP